ncbi:MAG: hypothetical protein KAW91_04395 [candidate division Zixibacteria bacterium]|nr:hypothetical protein [candidate division Zixibacteria bacterium]
MSKRFIYQLRRYEGLQVVSSRSANRAGNSADVLQGGETFDNGRPELMVYS